MSEEQKNSVSEKDKSEKLIYVLTGLLVVVIFGAIAVLYFNPSTDEKVYKPEKIQVAAEPKNLNQVENNVSSNLNEEVKRENEKTNTQKNETAKAVNSQTENNLKEENKNISKKNETTKKDSSIENKVENISNTKKNGNVNTANVVPESAEKKQKESKTLAENKKIEGNVTKKEETKTVKNRKTKILEKRYYYIQVSALASMEKARQVKSSLKREGFKNVIIIKEKGLYKVLIGRFNSMKEAFSFIRKHNIKGGWVRVLKNPQ